MNRGAEIDPTGVYRYRLWREWDLNLPWVGFVMLNPSTADATVDDATIRSELSRRYPGWSTPPGFAIGAESSARYTRRCIGFARAWGYGALEVVNLFCCRTKNPATLRRVVDPVGPEGDRYVLQMNQRTQAIVFGWGNHGGWQNRDQAALQLLGAKETYCLGVTQLGHPRHPLYLSRDTTLMPFRVGGVRAFVKG